VIYYRQCLLQKDNTTTTRWIPEKFAKEGKWIKLKNDDKEWEDGWLVKEVWSRMAEDLVLDASQDYKHQRKSSDI